MFRGDSNKLRGEFPVFEDEFAELEISDEAREQGESAVAELRDLAKAGQLPC